MLPSEKSINLQEVDLLARKRSLEAFLKSQDEPSGGLETIGSFPGGKGGLFLSTPGNGRDSELPQSSPGLTAPGSSPLDAGSPSPNSTPTQLSDDVPLSGALAPGSVLKTVPSAIDESLPAMSSTMATSAMLTATAQPSVKRKKPTADEKDVREAEKRQRVEEREKKKREKEEAEKSKAEEKAARAAEKAEKDAEKRQRAEEREKKKREKEEEETKKARQQRKLTAMFRLNHSIPKTENADAKTESLDGTSRASTPAKTSAKETSLYSQVFKPFFLKEHVKLAANLFAWDDQTNETKSSIFDEFVTGKRGDANILPLDGMKPLDKMELFQLPCLPSRGRVYPSVRRIMAEYQGPSPHTPVDLTTESQNTQILQTQQALKGVPLKSIKFHQDVRPPYVGTISKLPAGLRSLRKLSRKPFARNVLPLDYDYDSEAEWQEEDGEDVDIDDEEDEPDNDEEMDDFLDDSEDAGPVRPAVASDLEPDSTGLCWENGTCQNRLEHLNHYRMEFILDTFEHDSGVDPFSSSYWPTASKGRAGTSNETSTLGPASVPDRTGTGPAAAAAGLPTRPSTLTVSMAPPPPPSDALQALTQSAANAKKSWQPLSVDMQDKLKASIRSHPTLSKVGLIELFASENPKCLKLQIKHSFEILAEKAGKGYRVRGDV